jgi:hypothetical protein
MSGISLAAVSQNMKVFSGDTANYPDELYEYMRTLPEQYEDQLTEFLMAWEVQKLFTPTEQFTIIQLSDLMISQKVRPYPHFLNFLTCFLSFKKYNTREENYDQWVQGFEKLLRKNKTKIRDIDNVLNFTQSLLQDSIIYQSGSTTWKVITPDYRISNHKDLEVEFNQTDLLCYTRLDSIQLFNTKGIVYPIENRWEGEGGLVTWERGGQNRDEVFAILKDYEIDLTRSEYSAEHVTFTNKHYFDEPLEGILYDKVKLVKTPEDATYPRFDSYTKEFLIKNLYENIDYEGGLSMQGSKLVGTGTSEKTARLNIFRNDTLVLIASSVYFGFRTDRLSSQRTAVTIKLRNDSIYHPDLIFTYRVRNKELTLLKSDNYSSKGPYFNSYHEVDMNFEQLTWNMNEDVMRFTAQRGTAIGDAYFESVNYFNYDKFISMMMFDQEHPLYLLKSFAQMYGSESFPVEAFANYLSIPVNQVEQLAMRMAFGGYVFYDINTATITLKPRLYDYLAASINKIDYDVIGFSSRVQAPLENAIYDIRTNDLLINGIPEIHVSDSQNVIIYPRYNRIILKRNRNFQFDGVVDAGLLTFYGNNFFFNYDSFKINLQNVDSLQLNFLTGKRDNFGLPIADHIRNQLQYITGEVLIDKADNKSGRQSYPEYPIFISRESSYVYYDRPSIQNGVYESNDFFFEVYPFTMDSLDNFNYRELSLKGEFVSANIFPSFEKELTLQPDNSLGFRHLTPDEGYPVYNGKGTFNNEIWLSNRGLKGDGVLEYLTSTTWSHDFNFYPDSMNTISTRYTIEQQLTETQYPMVHSENNYIHWLPYFDEMYAEYTETDFTMYNDSTFLRGGLKLEPSGLSGWGRMDLKNSELESDLFTYQAFDIYSDTADFFLKSLNTEGFTVLTENINAHINYQQKKGWFRSNEGFTLVNFPENKYVSYIDYFVWDMTERELAMGSQTEPEEIDYTDEDTEPVGPRYISLHYDQDSLNFVSPLAYYDYENNQIKASGVKFIKVADARIYPEEGKLIVERDAHMRTLERATIRTDTLIKYHTLHTATIGISGRNYYSGFGNYDYIDENGETQLIHMDEIKVDSGGHTMASGDIYESANFRLSPVYQFQGRAFLAAEKKLLTFRGGVKIEHNCEKPLPDWLYFTSEIDPEDIYIPVAEQPVNIDREKIYAGMYMYYDSVHIYPALFSMHKSYSDRAVISANGYLYYDKAQSLFKIGSKEKINEFTLPQNYLSLHREDCKIYGEGEIDLGQDLGQVKLRTLGNIKHDLTKNETVLDVVMMMDFFLADDMLKLMALEVDSAPRLDPVDMNRLVYKKAMETTLGAENAQKFRDELSLFGSVKQIPAGLKHTIIFSDITLRWNDETNSYLSEGKIGIASIGDVQINKKVNGLLELQIKRSGDILDLYLELDRRNYYYFGYTRGVMQTLSSNPLYVETIMNMKTRDRKQKTGRGETSYVYLVATDRKKNTFVRKFREFNEGEANQADD